METIVAISTPLGGKSAVGIVRISGDTALNITKDIFSSNSVNDGIWTPNMMYLGAVNATSFKEQAFCVYYKAPKSYTGEDVVEFQVHGSEHIMMALVKELILKGARPAMAGEFTKRAYLNGKVNLSEAEGINMMINAESMAEINQAYRLMNGKLTELLNPIKEKLLSAMASLEVVLDYGEELAGEEIAKCQNIISDVYQQLSGYAKDYLNSNILKNGIDIAIAGLPNAGKSSLYNYLLKEDRAIVTDIAGTTRDVLKEMVEINGIKVNIIDTAGIRQGRDKVEEIGIKRAKDTIRSADLVLFLMDGSVKESKDEEDLYHSIQGKQSIRIINKSDKSPYFRRHCDIEISTKTLSNCQLLTDMITEKTHLKDIQNHSLISTERQNYCLTTALKHLSEALTSFDTSTIDCTSLDIRSAYNQLTRMEGNDVSEDIVNKVFSDFCVGK